MRPFLLFPGCNTSDRAHRLLIRSARGFTLIEIIIVIVIMGLMAVIGIPRFSLALAKAKARDAYNNMVIIHSAQQLYLANNGAYSTANSLTNINTMLGLNIIASDNTAYTCASGTSCSTATAIGGTSVFLITATLALPVTKYTGAPLLDNPNCTGSACP